MNNKKTVIIADDEPITRMDIASMLGEIGYEVIGEAGDGFVAAEMCKEKKPDIVLMDVKMPIFDGLGGTQSILRDNPTQCVVFLTAYEDDEIVKKAADMGVCGYIVKPVDQKLLKPTMEVAYAQSLRLKESLKAKGDAEKKLEESKYIRKAQSILQQTACMSEDEAYKTLRSMAMDRRISIGVLAKAICEQNSK